jgi:hypothetical protein
MGFVLRMRLLAVADHFRKPALLTLTVDRENFGSCQAAHDFISSMGRIGLLMKRLGVKLWVWVLEFQQKPGMDGHIGIFSLIWRIVLAVGLIWIGVGSSGGISGESADWIYN